MDPVSKQEDWGRILGEIAELNASIDAWDVPPTLMLVVYCTDDEHAHEGGDAERLQAIPLPIPDVMWNLGGPVGVLESMILVQKSGQTLPMPEAPLYPVGLLLATEGWGMSVPKENAEDVIEWAKSHDIEDHPDRVETRLLTGVDMHGNIYSMLHPRNDKVSDLMCTQNGGAPGGAVPEAMTRLLSSLMGRPIAYSGADVPGADIGHGFAE